MPNERILMLLTRDQTLQKLGGNFDKIIKNKSSKRYRTEQQKQKLKLIKQKVSQDTKDDLNSEDEEQQRVSQDTKDDLSSKDEEHFNTEEEKQDSDSGSQEIVWRNDMAFLHHLITCYRQFKKTGCFLK
ncbi:hypothetical protein HELRODRAFT_171363 [Helobdella robusta]|uniref:Uncharacterized protein n=1 Tax=Helobdella robusta TaxID=6412 RepID=T1F464_HELRO|nr:hypothetical protein HELRODRAFT_171363 [Helobdella robusta]ESO05702.1 hypothetical protein HELRODRAFT_171363 [Helobdella robusta]